MLNGEQINGCHIFDAIFFEVVYLFYVSWCTQYAMQRTVLCMSVHLFVCIQYSMFVASSSLFLRSWVFSSVLFISLINRNLITKINYYRMHGCYWKNTHHTLRAYFKQEKERNHMWWEPVQHTFIWIDYTFSLSLSLCALSLKFTIFSIT